MLIGGQIPALAPLPTPVLFNRPELQRTELIRNLDHHWVSLMSVVLN